MTAVLAESSVPEWKQRKHADASMPKDPAEMLASINAFYPQCPIEYEYKAIRTRGFSDTIHCIATLHVGQDARNDIIGRSSMQMCTNRFYARYQAVENLLGCVRQRKATAKDGSFK